MARLARPRRNACAAALACLFLALAGCAPADATAAPSETEEERLLPQIVRAQEERVAQIRQQVRVAHDQARAVRLRQTALEQHGRGDLAAALEPEALERERNSEALQRQLADEEAALRAYREYRDRIAPPRAPTLSAGRPMPTPTAVQRRGRR
jgi:hypothetical protein